MCEHASCDVLTERCSSSFMLLIWGTDKGIKHGRCGQVIQQRQPRLHGGIRLRASWARRSAACETYVSWLRYGLKARGEMPQEWSFVRQPHAFDLVSAPPDTQD